MKKKAIIMKTKYLISIICMAIFVVSCTKETETYKTGNYVGTSGNITVSLSFGDLFIDNAKAKASVIITIYTDGSYTYYHNYNYGSYAYFDGSGVNIVFPKLNGYWGETASLNIEGQFLDKKTFLITNVENGKLESKKGYESNIVAPMTLKYSEEILDSNGDGILDSYQPEFFK